MSNLSAPFAERIAYLEPTQKKKSKAKWLHGIWLGRAERSDETIVGTPSGIVLVRSVRRLPTDQAWQAEAVNEVRGTPRHPRPTVDLDVAQPRAIQPGPVPVPEENESSQGSDSSSEEDIKVESDGMADDAANEEAEPGSCGSRV